MFLKYEEFVVEKQLTEKTIIHKIIEFDEYSDYDRKELNRLNELSNGLFFKELEISILNDELNEGILNKLKSVVSGKADATVKIGDEEEKVNKSVVKKLMDSVKDVGKLTKTIQKAKNAVVGMFSISSAKNLLSIDQSKIKKAVESQIEKTKKSKDDIKEEVSHSKETIDFIMKEATKQMKGLLGKKEVKDKIESSVDEVKESKRIILHILENNTECYTINEIINEIESEVGYSNMLLNEGGSKVSSLVHGLAKYPPFKWLNQLASFFERNISSAMNQLSKFVSDKLNGPGPYEFPIISAVLATIGEIKVKGAVKYGILKPAIYFIFPPASVVISVLATIATIIAVYETLEKVGLA